MDCIFQINDEWHISGQFEADVIPRMGENLTLFGLISAEPGREFRRPLIGFRIEEVTYELPPPRSESRDITVGLYSTTPTVGGRIRIRELARDLLAEGWEVWDDARGERVTDPETIRDVELSLRL